MADRAASAALVALFLLAGCAKPAAGSGKQSAAPVAKVAGDAITDADLAVEAKTALAAVESRYAEEVWNVKRKALDGLVDQRLLSAQARKEGLSVDALLAREVTARITEPDEAALRNVYEQTKATGRPLPPFPEVRTEIADYLKGQQAQQLRAAYVGGLRATSKVEITFPPFLPARVDVKADGPSKGKPDAPVTIVEFSDYECTFCSGAEATVRQLVDAYPGKVRLVYRDFPLSIHANAPKAAEAARCAGEQQRYWDMHDLLFQNQKALAVPDLKRHARALGLDGAAFDACVDSGRMAPAVEADRKAGEALGLNSTPTFFVDGRPYVGVKPFEMFRDVVDHTLAAGR